MSIRKNFGGKALRKSVFEFFEHDPACPCRTLSQCWPCQGLSLVIVGCFQTLAPCRSTITVCCSAAVFEGRLAAHVISNGSRLVTPRTQPAAFASVAENALIGAPAGVLPRESCWFSSDGNGHRRTDSRDGGGPRWGSSVVRCTYRIRICTSACRARGRRGRRVPRPPAAGAPASRRARPRARARGTIRATVRIVRARRAGRSTI